MYGSTNCHMVKKAAWIVLEMAIDLARSLEVAVSAMMAYATAPIAKL